LKKRIIVLGRPQENRIKKKMSLKDKREKKLDIDIGKYEFMVDDIIKRYRIEERIEDITSLYIDPIFKDEKRIIDYNNSKGNKKRKHAGEILTPETFNTVFAEVRTLLHDVFHGHTNNIKNSFSKNYKKIDDFLKSYTHKNNKLKNVISKITELKNDFEMQFDNTVILDDVFKEFKDREILNNAKKGEELDNLTSAEFEYIHRNINCFHKKERIFKTKLEIINNIMTKISLTYNEDGVDKLDFASYHYILKALDKNSIRIRDKYPAGHIKGYTKQITSLSLIEDEIINVVAQHNPLGDFVATIYSIIETYITQYKRRSKIGKFYFDILMITPEVLTDRILRYVSMIAIKNKNPLTIRSIFSAYVTLIRRNIKNYFSVNLTEVKVGYYPQLESLINGNEIIYSTNSKNTLYNAYIESIENDLTKIYPKNYDVYQTYSKFFGVNYNTMYDKYKNELKDEKHEYNFIDFFVVYMKMIHNNLDIDHNSISGGIKLSKKITDKTVNKKKTLTIKSKLFDQTGDKLKRVFGDYESVDTYLDVLSKMIVPEINQNNYLFFENKKTSFEKNKTLSQSVINELINDYVENIDMIIPSSS
jgi:hypothetical protein